MSWKHSSILIIIFARRLLVVSKCTLKHHHHRDSVCSTALCVCSRRRHHFTSCQCVYGKYGFMHWANAYTSVVVVVGVVLLLHYNLHFFCRQNTGKKPTKAPTTVVQISIQPVGESASISIYETSPLHTKSICDKQRSSKPTE